MIVMQGYGQPPGGPAPPQPPGFGAPPPPGYGAPPPPGYGAPPPMPPAQQESSLPIVAGIFLLLGALADFATGASLIFGGGIVAGLPIMGGFFATILIVCGAIVIIFGLVALLGAIFSFKKERWGLALVGGILGLLVVGIYGLGFIFCLIGLILVAISKQYYH